MHPFRVLALLATAQLAISCASSGGRDSLTNPAQSPGVSTTVSAASMDGRFLFLGDGSIWNVDWADARAAARLNSGDAVMVKRGNNKEFPYEIASPRGSSISARLGKKLD